MTSTGDTPKPKPTFLPLEKRILEDGQTPAFSKKWAPDLSTKWVKFQMPSPVDLGKRGVVEKWEALMEAYVDDLKWLLALPHHVFWSTIVFSPSLRRVMLNSFEKDAPRFYDHFYSAYESHRLVWQKYKEIFVLVFRVYMRLATHKESKEDFITPSFWSQQLRDIGLLSLPVLQSLSTLFENKENPLFARMVENVVKEDKKILQELEKQIPTLGEKWSQLGAETEVIVSEENWEERSLGDILWFYADSIFSILKFLKAYPLAAETLFRFPNFLLALPSAYEHNTHVWGKIIARCPHFHDRVAMVRLGILRLYRYTLVTPTLNAVDLTPNDRRVDDFFEIFSAAIDEQVFVHDYEKQYPFRADMQALLAKGVFVDDTRMEYMANAISSCFHFCGEEYSVEKIVVDPLYDPNFDRQLLGACSLEVIGIELESLVSQVKDLLPELPNSYVEAVLKHYSYVAEHTINALLEGSVPSRLEKYKSPEYIKAQATPTHRPKEEDWKEKLPAHPETFMPSKRERPQQGMQSLDADTKSQILTRLLRIQLEGEECNKPKADDGSSYIDHDLLPPTYVTNDIDYDDEYDDTYDDVGTGMTEPDIELIKPLNQRRGNVVGKEEEEEDEEISNAKNPRNFDAFCEDPAIVRARFERKREEQRDRNRPQGQRQGQGPPPGERDVIGRAKGQGQDKDVVYNRRQKTANKGGGGSFKKRSDFKRKEF